jgi:hypothetical protein
MAALTTPAAARINPACVASSVPTRCDISSALLITGSISNCSQSRVVFRFMSNSLARRESRGKSTIA